MGKHLRWLKKISMEMKGNDFLQVVSKHGFATSLEARAFLSGTIRGYFEMPEVPSPFEGMPGLTDEENESLYLSIVHRTSDTGA